MQSFLFCYTVLLIENGYFWLHDAKSNGRTMDILTRSGQIHSKFCYQLVGTCFFKILQKYFKLPPVGSLDISGHLYQK